MALPLYEGARDEVIRAGGTPRRIYMNCSGKHAGMLAACVAAGWDTSSYLSPDHPLQRSVAAQVERLSGEVPVATGIDGCGAPLFAISLTGLARAFGRLTTADPGTPERTVADAMRAHPELVAGTGRDDTLMMQAIPGLLMKAGAEGVHAAALGDGRAIALKIADGHERARTPVLVAALRHLGVDRPGPGPLRAWRGARRRRPGRVGRGRTRAVLSPSGVRRRRARPHVADGMQRLDPSL